MTAGRLGPVETSFDQLLGAVGDYHEHLQQERGRPGLNAAGRDRIDAALEYATELIEVLESLAADRIRRLAALPALL